MTSVLGRYRIVGEIGQGAMGTVYKAVDPVIDRTVAIKTINLNLSKQELEEYEARFQQEIKAAGRLNHPNIVTIYDVGKTESVAYMAMEFLEGRELNWVVRLPNDELAGYVQATVLASGAALLGYEFASRHWRQGIGSTSINAMLEELVQTYSVHTFVAVLKVANYRSMGLLRNLGFEPGTAENAKTYEAETDETVLLKTATTFVAINLQ